MAWLFQSGMYGANNGDNTTTNRFYDIQLISEEYIIQNNTKIYGQFISAVELVVKSQYICTMQENTNCYWKQTPLLGGSLILDTYPNPA